MPQNVTPKNFQAEIDKLSDADLLFRYEKYCKICEIARQELLKRKIYVPTGEKPHYA